MAKFELKTKQTEVDVSAFIDTVESETRRADAHQLVRLFEEITGDPAKMWGPSIIGFGSYHYKYDSGHEGTFSRSGFSPRKANLVVYLMCNYCDPETEAKNAALRAKLGKHKISKSCLYINKLADVDMEAWRK